VKANALWVVVAQITLVVLDSINSAQKSAGW